MISQAAVGEARTVLLLTDSIPIDSLEAMLDDITVLINCGQVPIGIFSTEERVELAEKLNVNSGAESLANAVPEGWQIGRKLNDNVRKNLHVIVSLSSEKAATQRLLERFPSLLSCSIADWFDAWPVDVLRVIATNFFREMSQISRNVIDLYVQLAIFIHTSLLNNP